MRHILQTFSLIGAAIITCAASSSAGFVADPLYQDRLPDGRINVGNANLFTALTFSDFNLNQTNNGITGGGSLIQGNVGVGGSGDWTMSNGDVYGDVYIHNGGKVKLSGPAKIHGNINTVNSGPSSPIDLALQDAWSLTNKAASEASTSNYTVTQGSFTQGGSVNIGSSQSISITGGANQKVVLSLQNFVMNGGANFTLQGTATTSFIINITNTFSVNGGSHISLVNVPASNVLFNVIGTGSKVAFTGSSTMSGILLAAQRQIGIDPGFIHGRVIGNQINITSGGQIISQ